MLPNLDVNGANQLGSCLLPTAYLTAEAPAIGNVPAVSKPSNNKGSFLIKSEVSTSALLNSRSNRLPCENSFSKSAKSSVNRLISKVV